MDTRRRKIAVCLLVLTVAGLLATGVLIARTAQQFIADRDSQTWTPSELFAYGYEMEGNNDRATYNDAVRLDPFRRCVMALLIAGMGAVGVLMCCRVKLEVIYLVAALCLGLAYMFVITPYSVPDELQYYNSSYLVSGYLLRQEDPKIVDMRYLEIVGLTGHQNTPE